MNSENEKPISTVNSEKTAMKKETEKETQNETQTQKELKTAPENASQDRREKPLRFGIEAYGVRIGIETEKFFTKSQIKASLKNVLPNGYAEIEYETAVHYFSLKKIGKAYFIYKNNEIYFETEKKLFIINALDSQIRITVAEFAVGKVFVHAGVVAWKNLGIMIPASSFHGKSTLVAELVKKGAEYYSDEYAVLDEDGFVHPFPKMLSMRGIIDDYTQKDIPVEDFGGVPGTKPVPVALVLITEYQQNALWRPQTLSMGNGVMEILAHTISIRRQPEFSLNVLNKIARRAIISKTRRGEARQTADLLLGFFDQQAIKI